jgi:hypothetical protein
MNYFTFSRNRTYRNSKTSVRRNRLRRIHYFSASLARGNNVASVIGSLSGENIIGSLTTNTSAFINTSMMNSTLMGTNGLNPSSTPLLGQVTDKEYCQAKKLNHRFNVPLGTKFYRVRVKPWKPTLSVAQNSYSFSLFLSFVLGCYFSVPFVFYSILTSPLLVMSSIFLHACSISSKRAVCLLNMFSSCLFLVLLFNSLRCTARFLSLILFCTECDV